MGGHLNLLSKIFGLNSKAEAGRNNQLCDEILDTKVPTFDQTVSSTCSSGGFSNMNRSQIVAFRSIELRWVGIQ